MTFDQDPGDAESPRLGMAGAPRGLSFAKYKIDDVRIVGARPIEFTQETVDGRDVLGVKHQYEYELKTTDVVAVELTDTSMAPLYLPRPGDWVSTTPQEMDEMGILYPTPEVR